MDSKLILEALLAEGHQVQCRTGHRVVGQLLAAGIADVWVNPVKSHGCASPPDLSRPV